MNLRIFRSSFSFVNEWMVVVNEARVCWCDSQIGQFTGVERMSPFLIRLLPFRKIIEGNRRSGSFPQESSKAHNTTSLPRDTGLGSVFLWSGVLRCCLCHTGVFSPPCGIQCYLFSQGDLNALFETQRSRDLFCALYAVTYNCLVMVDSRVSRSKTWIS